MELLQQYDEMFQDTFPISFLGLSDEDAIKILKDCLSKREPYKLSLPEGVVL